MQIKILIAGAPGVGKTTLFKKVIPELDLLHPVGFYTGEIRERGTRVGFSLNNLDGAKHVFAHVDF